MVAIVKYGIIGVGMMGREHLINLYHLKSEGVSVVAIADPHLPSQKYAQKLADSFDWPLQVSFVTFMFSDVRVSFYYRIRDFSCYRAGTIVYA